MQVDDDEEEVRAIHLRAVKHKISSSGKFRRIRFHFLNFNYMLIPSVCTHYTLVLFKFLTALSHWLLGALGLIYMLVVLHNQIL